VADVIGRAIIEVAPDVTRFTRQLTRDLNKAFRGFKKVSVGVSVGSIRKAFVEISKLNTALRATVLGFTALGAKFVVAGLLSAANAAVELSGALLTVPAAGAAAALTMAALVVGLHGVDDIFKAIGKGDIDKFNEALKELSPKAQQALGVIKQFAPQLKEFKNAVQDALFADLKGPIQELFLVFLPRVQRAFVGITTEINKAGKELIKFLTTGQTIKDFDTLTGNTTKSLGLLGQAVVPLAQIIRDVVTVGSQFLPSLVGELTVGIVKFSDFIAKARESGKLADFIANGIAKLHQVIDVVVNLSKAIGGIFRAADDAGFGFLDMLSKLSQSLSKFLNSVEGQGALRNFFLSAREAGEALAPVLKSLFNLITNTIAPILARFATIISPSIAIFIDAIGRAFQAAAPGIESFAASVGKFLETIAPALPKLGELAGVIADVLGRALVAVAPALERFITLLADELIKLFQDPEFVNGLIDLVVAFGDLLVALVPLVPVLGDLAKVILPALAKVLRILAEAADPLIDLFKLLIPVIFLLARAFEFIGFAVLGLISILHGLVFFFTDVLPGAFQGAIEILDEVLSVLGVHLIKRSLEASNAFTDAVNRIPGPLGAAGTASEVFAGRISGGFKNAADAAQFEMGRIGVIVTGAVEPLGAAGSALGNAYTGNLRNSLGGAVSVASEIVGGIKSILFGSTEFGAAGSAVGNSFARGMIASIAAVRAASLALAGAAGSALPRSPAEIGPFSGRGWTPFRGLSLAQGFAQGMKSGKQLVARASLELAQSASLNVGGAQRPDSKLFASSPAQTQAPVIMLPPPAADVNLRPEVKVFVDGKEMRVIATEVVDERDRAIKRNVSSGVGGAR